MTFLLLAALTIAHFSTLPLDLQEAAATIGDRLVQDAAVKAAIERVRRDEGQVIEEQVRLCEIPAPPFKETARAEAYRRAFQAAGLKNVRIDRVGNVLGERPGRAPRPHLVFTAHLDTVFPEDTNVQTSRSGAIIRGPASQTTAAALPFFSASSAR